MAGVNYPITGAPKQATVPADGSVPLRLEVRDLQNNYPDQWNLYLLGLQAFYQLDETSDLSYYGIAGIHGRPYRSWGGVKGTNASNWQGYCTHTSILFAPWHRPYLALFEQVLYGIIQDIASQFPDETRAQYQQAAATFRLPYWDWAATPPDGDQYFPSSVGGSTTVTVITAESSGKEVQIPNPLYSYKFSPLNPEPNDFISDRGVPYNKWPTTLRYPTSPRKITATSDEQQVFDALESQFDGLQSSIMLLMSDPNYKDFAAFSNHQWQVNELGSYASLEDVHNSIHAEVGGNVGHMAELDYSAFDPVFWLHHANVDRLFAIWQALNPDSYTINENAGDGTFVITSASTETAQTPLAPFSDATGTKFWTSELVRQTETFNYAYPETQKWAFSTAADYTSSVQQAVLGLYGGATNKVLGIQSLSAASEDISKTTNKKKAANGSTEGSAEGPVDEQVLPARDIEAAPQSHPVQAVLGKVKEVFASDSEKEDDSNRELDLESEIGKPETLTTPKPTICTEYICNIKVPKHILRQTFRVHVFIGDFDSSTDTWHTQDALIGTVAVFGKDPATTGCSKCVNDSKANVIITGTVPLTSAIVKQYEAGNIGSLTKENVLPWLTKNLHWRVTLADGTDKRREEVEGLKVSVVTTEVGLSASGFPQYSGVYEVHPEVTDGRPGGYCDGDQV